MALPQELLDAVRLEKWLIDFSHKNGEILTRDAQRLSPIREKNRLDTALAELEGLNRIKLDLGGKRKLIKVNPMVLT